MPVPAYPWPNTNAARALVHIQANPGCSQNAVGRAIRADAALIVRRLERHGLVRIVTDQRGYHSIWPAA